MKRTSRESSLMVAVAMACLIAVPSWADTPSCRDWTHWRGGGEQTGYRDCEIPAVPKLAWEFSVDDAFSAAAVIADGVIYVGSEEGTLYAVGLRDGKVRWKFEEPEIIQAAPSVCGDRVYVGDDMGTMFAVDRKTGKKIWSFESKGEIISAATCAGDRLVFGSYDGFVYCLSTDGKQLWKLETGGRVHGTPAVFDGRVAAAGCDEYLHVVELASGKSIAKVSMGSVSGASTAVIGDRAYVGTYGNQVLGVDMKAQKVLWRFEDPDRQFPFMSSAAVAQGTLVIGGRDKFVRALSLSDGKARWAIRTKGRVDGSPVIVRDKVLVGSGDGVLYQFNLSDGKETWRFDTGSSLSASPAVADGFIVIGSLDGVLYAFADAKDVPPKKSEQPNP
ncbi:MAG: PQQ-binding-like beta-propeller repeat protein [Phycisphaerae bacterium]